MSRRYLIIRYHSDSDSEVKLHQSHDHTHHKDDHPLKKSLEKLHDVKGIPFEYFANELMAYGPFIKYLQENGSHFTTDLADYLCDLHKKNERNSDQVGKALRDSSMKLPKDITLGDFTYLVNFEYHSHPDAIAKAYLSIKNQPYPGYIFNRWLADHIGMGQSIPWEAFV